VGRPASALASTRASTEPASPMEASPPAAPPDDPPAPALPPAPDEPPLVDVDVALDPVEVEGAPPAPVLVVELLCVPPPVADVAPLVEPVVESSFAHATHIVRTAAHADIVRFSAIVSSLIRKRLAPPLKSGDTLAQSLCLRRTSVRRWFENRISTA
jgi:hypothetical protein